MLAIVIPYYKINYFEDTLASLSSQTDKRFKVYIGNDASSESPENSLKNFEGSFSYEYFEFQENLGAENLTKQWERCIDLTNDESWIMILGDDDTLGDNVVAAFYNSVFKKDFDSNVIRCATVVIDEQKKNKSELHIHPELETGIEFSMRKLRGETRSSLSEYFFKKEAYLRHKFTHFPSAFYSDDKAWFDFSENKLILSLNIATVFIRISDYSLSGTVEMRQLRKAELKYLIFLYKFQMKKFTKKDRIFILNKLEHSLFCNNVNSLYLWVSIYFSHLFNFQRHDFFRFQKKFIKFFLKY